METNPQQWIAAVRRSHDRLASIVEPLTPAERRGPSYHSWTIAENMSHLGSQAQIFEGWLTASVEHTPPPGRDEMVPIWDTWNAKDPDQQVADSLAVNEALVRRLEGLSPEQLAGMHLEMFGMTLDAAGLPRMRLSEHAVHTWDIAVARDPSAQVAPDAVALLIDTLGPLAARAGKPQGKAFRLHVVTSDPARDLFLEVGEGVTISEWTNQPVDGELRIPAEAFLRLVYGRLDDQHAPPVEITAPDVSLDDLRAVFPGA